ncbi:unnamed protein product [Symbiodinium microadriaticum]|nr:unnamed protein product [Symbiodinium microadriaticum]
MAQGMKEGGKAVSSSPSTASSNARSPAAGKTSEGTHKAVSSAWSRSMSEPVQPASSPSKNRPVVPRLSLRRVFNQKERAGDYSLKMDYQCDTPEMSESELECTDDLLEDSLEISATLLDEAIDTMLLRRRYAAQAGLAWAQRRHQEPRGERLRNWWHQLFGGCFHNDEEDISPRGMTVSLVETVPVSTPARSHLPSESLFRIDDGTFDEAARKQRLPERREIYAAEIRFPSTGSARGRCLVTAALFTTLPEAQQLDCFGISAGCMFSAFSTPSQASQKFLRLKPPSGHVVHSGPTSLAGEAHPTLVMTSPSVAASPDAASPGKERMLRVEFKGQPYDWFSLDDMGSLIQSEEFASTLKENINHYFNVPFDEQAVFDDEGILVSPLDFKRALQHPRPYFRVFNLYQLPRHLQEQTVEKLATLAGEVSRLQHALGDVGRAGQLSHGQGPGYPAPELPSVPGALAPPSAPAEPIVPDAGKAPSLASTGLPVSPWPVRSQLQAPVAEPPPAASPNCPYCGTPYEPEGALFCGSCGKLRPTTPSELRSLPATLPEWPGSNLG